MRRVTLFVNGTSSNGKVVAVFGSLEDLLSAASSKLGIKVSRVYNENRGLIDDITLIRDDDVLYVSEEDSSEDPRDDLTDPEKDQTHTDWLTLNVGGRCFTTTRGPFPFNKLGGKDLFWEARVRHADNMASPSELVLGNGGSDGGNVSLLQDAGVSAPILPANPEDFWEGSLMGLNFNGADLSRLDLRYINFKMANLSGANLSHANLSGANLERADLSLACLDGVKMLCTNAEGASLRGCNFEDPAGIKANLEGANLKGVDMEGSQMTGINLRNCDLSGCDLQEANLRGSNVKGAIFEEMLTPLHMSQSVR
ncbi:BTB/POZ domain containing protein KCTD9 [Dissostichus eleginoides]|uniref:BTB/POZ domain containing protein KCTD9 n=1 Tax=Dissostichus eleginoides TaxID=100907 RepID=A0AAD9BIA6_DISEL|nr:BTB/POZ domain containing protein KCTD9 [Dissostichus eleginoides]